jgi:hypothetical protein
MSLGLKDELFALKDRLDTIESQLTGQIKEIEERDEKWKRMQAKVDRIVGTQGDIVKLNVGGKVFSVSVNTINSMPGTLLQKLIESGRVDLKQEIFFDRSPKLFEHILEYIRVRHINLTKLSKDDFEQLKDDADYFNIIDLEVQLAERLRDVEFVSFDFNGAYIYNGTTAGTNKVEDITDKTCMKGICANSPGWIVIELNSIWDFEEIEIGGWKGNSNIWYTDNGAGASIQTSVDNKIWRTVGSIPSGYGNNIVKVKLTKSTAKYIKFNHNSYIGIGYLYVKKIAAK